MRALLLTEEVAEDNEDNGGADHVKKADFGKEKRVRPTICDRRQDKNAEGEQPNVSDEFKREPQSRNEPPERDEGGEEEGDDQGGNSDNGKREPVFQERWAP